MTATTCPLCGGSHGSQDCPTLSRQFSTTDYVRFTYKGREYARRVQHVWVESAPESARRGPMVAVYLGGGVHQFPESECAAYDPRTDDDEAQRTELLSVNGREL